MWQSLITRYGTISVVGAINAWAKLESTKLADGEDLQTHLQTMQSLWKDANDEGTSITDSIYRTILVSSLPITFYTIIRNVISATNATEAKVIIINWKATMDRMGGGASGNIPSIPTNLTTTALATKPKPNWSQMVCENCHCRGHGIGDCYWEGGGKEGQFPAHFG